MPPSRKALLTLLTAIAPACGFNVAHVDCLAIGLDASLGDGYNFQAGPQERKLWCIVDAAF
eukprot:3911508-Alexandrium_andersonii.AAC.1